MPSIIQCHTPSYVPNGREVAVFSTERGLVRVRLAGRVAPVNVGNFVELARAGFYDGLKFHGGSTGERINSGDPMTRTLTGREVLKVAKNRWGAMGMGGPGYFVRGEFGQQPLEPAQRRRLGHGAARGARHGRLAVLLLPGPAS